MSKRFVVLTRKDAQAADRYVFIRDGWSWLAFIMPVLWLLWHRVWFVAVMFVIASATIALLANDPAFALAAFVAGSLAQIYAGLEGGNWRITSLLAKGWTGVATLSAETVHEAELRFAMMRTARTQPPPLPAKATKAPLPDRPFVTSDLLFAEPGRH